MKIFNSLHPTSTVLGTKHIQSGVVENFPQVSDILRKSWQRFQDKKILNNKNTNLTGKMSPYFSDLYDPSMKHIINIFKPYVQNFMLQGKQYFPGVMEYVECGEIWISEYNEGHKAHSHTHYPFHIAMSYYFDIEDATPIQFEVFDPEQAHFPNNLQNNSTVTITPTEGLYVLFDGDIKHSVPECKGKRIVVASNWYFDLKGYCEKGKKTTKAETDDWLEHK